MSIKITFQVLQQYNNSKEGNIDYEYQPKTLKEKMLLLNRLLNQLNNTPRNLKTILTFDNVKEYELQIRANIKYRYGITENME